tara:strand:+ start:656 stop:838 length:183 start_codon:yes stop_codon:yes gene_type:complete
MYVDSIDTTSLFVDYLLFYQHDSFLGDVKDAWELPYVTEMELVFLLKTTSSFWGDYNEAS